MRGSKGQVGWMGKKTWIVSGDVTSNSFAVIPRMYFLFAMPCNQVEGTNSFLQKGRDPGQHKHSQSDLIYRPVFQCRACNSLGEPNLQWWHGALCQIKQGFIASSHPVSYWRSPEEDPCHPLASTTVSPRRGHFKQPCHPSDHVSLGQTRSSNLFHKSSTSRPIGQPTHKVPHYSLWCFQSLLWILSHSLERKPVSLAVGHDTSSSRSYFSFFSSLKLFGWVRK